MLLACGHMNPSEFWLLLLFIMFAPFLYLLAVAVPLVTGIVAGERAVALLRFVTRGRDGGWDLPAVEGAIGGTATAVTITLLGAWMIDVLRPFTKIASWNNGVLAMLVGLGVGLAVASGRWLPRKKTFSAAQTAAAWNALLHARGKTARG